MIKHFSNVYAGHVDLGDMGQDATPANERRYSNAHLASVFDKTEAIARTMDEHGYSILWLAEHHFQHEGYEVIPNLMMAAARPCWLRRAKSACGWCPNAGGCSTRSACSAGPRRDLSTANSFAPRSKIN